jgi:ferredoxin
VNTMNVSADHARCVGAGNCVLTAPQVFDQDNDGVVLVLDSHPPKQHWKATRTAMLHCPAQAIVINDDV